MSAKVSTPAQQTGAGAAARARRARNRRRALLPLRLILKDPLAVTGATILVIVISMALFAPLIATHDPNAILEEEEGSVLAQHEGQWVIAATMGELALTGLASSGEQAVAVGRLGTYYELDNGSWHKGKVPVSDVDLTAVSLSPAGATVVVGEAGTILLRGAPGASGVNTMNSDDWTVVEPLASVKLLGAAWLSERQAVLVGAAETVWLLDAETAELTALVSPVNRKMELRSVAASNPAGVVSGSPGAAEVIIVGERGLALTLESGQLTQLRLPSTRDLNDVTFSASGEQVLITGERGTLLRRVDGEWQLDSSPDARALRAGWIGDDGSAYAVGRNGVVLSLQGDEWIKEETGTERHFRAVDQVAGAMLTIGSDPFVNKLAPPSAQHWFGTDHLGRDLFSQNVFGSRVALIVGFIGALLVVLIGTNIGLVAGYYGGRTDMLLMRFVDVMYGIPFEPFAMILVLLFDPSLTIVIVAVSLLTWRTVARLIRSQVLSLSQRPFVKAARVAGASDLRIIYQHIAPNILPLVLLQLAITVGAAIIAEATLSFLGLGPPKSISWGGILHNARLSGAWRTAWWWNIPPGAFIMLTVLGVFFISRALEVLANPRLRSR